MQFFTAILSALALAVMMTTATPIDSDEDGVISLTVPDILSPKAGDIWYFANTTALVSWDPTAIPHEAGINKEFIGTLLLGHDDGGTSFAFDSLDVKNPLAQGIKLRQTSQSMVTIPTNKPDGTRYFVALMVDFGAFRGYSTSDLFTITSATPSQF